MKQTAVEWLEEELADKLKVIILNMDYKLMEKLFAQALAMEKEQIMNAWNSALINTNIASNSIGVPYDKEKYYNETYNK